jgi:hypothetical protein
MLGRSAASDASHAGNTSSNLVGVTTIRDLGFSRAFSIAIGAAHSRRLEASSPASDKPGTVPSLN